MRLYRLCNYFLILFFSICQHLAAQSSTIKGQIIAEGQALELASVVIAGSNIGATSDSLGNYTLDNLKAGTHTLKVSCIGFESFEKVITLKAGEHLVLNFDLSQYASTLKEVVITGTLKAVSRLESPVPVEVYTPAYFKKNPTSNICEALQNVNGVRPQINCNVCNTGDIHINGLDGPYTMVLIDGMPIVSSLGTVYGLSGIPNALVERIEIVKGPASSLYGSEAVGGLINIITKKPQNAPLLSAEFMGTSWGEYNTDLGFKLKVGKIANVLTGINYFNFQNRIDNNHDNFTDMTLQNRISVFQKWDFGQRKDKRLFNIAGRYMYENRWGGDLRWNEHYRGGDSIYGESIYTKRWELIGNYQLPSVEKLLLTFSYNNHNQDSRYGTTSYIATQHIGFAQLVWDKKIGRNDFLVGAAMRYTYYDDNTPATFSADSLHQNNAPQITWLPGVFVQDEIAITPKQKLLLGFRYDYNSYHGNIFTPRLAYKLSFGNKHTLRFNAGTGFRVVNLFTEEHAALTGARVVIIKEDLAPEQSYNANINYNKTIVGKKNWQMDLDVSAFYTYFNNRIIPDYDSSPNAIFYTNLDGYAESKGICLNMDIALANGLKFILGGTLMENTISQQNVKTQQILTENFTGTWAASYKFQKLHLGIDYTGNIYSPMRLPLLGPSDPRRAYSPWWSIQNIQLSFDGINNLEIYGGVKNLLNWTPNKGNPFIIARAHDPFDRDVQFDANGQAIATPSNPYALTFDPTYVYGPNQGIRVFLGVRYRFE